MLSSSNIWESPLSNSHSSGTLEPLAELGFSSLHTVERKIIESSTHASDTFASHIGVGKTRESNMPIRSTKVAPLQAAHADARLRGHGIRQARRLHATRLLVACNLDNEAASESQLSVLKDDATSRSTVPKLAHWQQPASQLSSSALVPAAAPRAAGAPSDMHDISTIPRHRNVSTDYAVRVRMPSNPSSAGKQWLARPLPAVPPPDVPAELVQPSDLCHAPAALFHPSSRQQVPCALPRLPTVQNDASLSAVESGEGQFDAPSHVVFY